jgi:CheY-like chemotaxis protein
MAEPSRSGEEDGTADPEPEPEAVAFVRMPRVASTTSDQQWAPNLRVMPRRLAGRTDGERNAMSRSILVVDDDQAVVRALADLLTAEGYRVRCAYDGHEALREITREPPDLVLSDVMMPELDGATLAHQLWPRGRGIPIVLLSAVYATINLPGVQFLAKPFELDDLLRVIARALGPDPPSAPADDRGTEEASKRPRA